jgi:hypothetical protein
MCSKKLALLRDNLNHLDLLGEFSVDTCGLSWEYDSGFGWDDSENEKDYRWQVYCETREEVKKYMELQNIKFEFRDGYDYKSYTGFTIKLHGG